MAINSILQAESRSIPFLLFGPPGNWKHHSRSYLIAVSSFVTPGLDNEILFSSGTGKTRTLVGAILEIIRSTDKHILVTANSNAACDEITERLAKVSNPCEMFRLYAKSFAKNRLKKTIEPMCNYKNDEFQFPSLEYLYKFRIVICTLATAGCLARARNADNFFNSAHFSYVMIDEAACVHEPMLLAAIAGLCTEHGEVKSAIILAGDPKQLDPVTQSTHAKKFGYNISFMEYLMEKPLYKRKGERFNEKYIVQLIKNYRSHSAIIEIPSQMCYDGMLECNASEG